MANVEITRLIDSARFRLPGALDAALKLELFAVLDEFFQGSNIWTEDIQFYVSPTSTCCSGAPEVYPQELIVADGGVINRLMGVVDSGGFRQHCIMPTPGFVVVVSAPSKGQVYTARVAKTVTDPVTPEGYPECPAWILGKYNNEILDGLLARMMSQLAKPYSSPPLAMVHGKLFRQAISRAKVEAQHGNLYRGQNWSFPQSFNRRRHAAGY